MSIRTLLVVNADWYFWSHRLSLAKALRERGFDVTIAANQERNMGTKIREEGFRFLPLNIHRKSTSLWQELASLKQLLSVYRNEKPDVVHQITVKPVIYGSIAARIVRVPVIINTIPGAGFIARRRSPLAYVALLGYRIALSGKNTYVILQNPEDLTSFVSQRLSKPDRSILIRSSGVDINKFLPTPPPSGLPIVMMASRLIWDKGVREFVQAAGILQNRKIPCRMVLVGQPDTNTIDSVPEEFIRDSQSRGLIEWWGPRSDMPEVLQQASIIALPTYYPEGVPKILLEAAASGRPIVATDVPGCREIVRDGENGLLVAPKDAESLAQAIQCLLEDPARRESMGLRGRQLVVAEFSEEMVNAATIRVYEQALNASGILKQPIGGNQ